MKIPKFFISSTIYDFSDLRSSIKYYLEQQGYPVLASEYNDFPKPLDVHSYEACIEALKSADYFILLIGSRVGGWYDEGNTVSITQQEYREAYKLHKEGKIKLMIFVRSSIWDVREDRKALQALLKTLDLDDEIKKKIVNHESKFLSDAEFINNFISEVCRVNDAKLSSASGGVRPTGNWIHPFSAFSDIAQAIQAQVLLAPPHEAVMRKLLISDLMAILSRGLCNSGGGGLNTPISTLNEVIGKLNFPEEVLDNGYWDISGEHWAILGRLGIECSLILFLPPIALQRAIELGFFMEFDINTNEYYESPAHVCLCKLVSEMNFFKFHKDNNSLKITFSRFNQAGMRFSSHDVLFFLGALDRWANILELAICLLNYLKYDIFKEPILRPANPVPSMQKNQESSLIDEPKIEAILKSYRH